MCRSLDPEKEWRAGFVKQKGTEQGDKAFGHHVENERRFIVPHRRISAVVVGPKRQASKDGESDPKLGLSYADALHRVQCPMRGRLWNRQNRQITRKAFSGKVDVNG